ncbi:Major Facilitator Superfamily protein [Sporothrix schenckii 1099-18]|uniref:Major Facilitator Superfamily protein n=1 Tax=Sporothrix schenckii 1099-18 TaxID=1397361 RepID=A0A0F2LVF9_SPOSC|nr:Major Facilitator Superfamily protein [Sporothrix schenckii 1099-18]KJR81437.1 Major Facilitator Superfamily protein [Sporothrix schenckii 1099-18]
MSSEKAASHSDPDPDIDVEAAAVPDTPESPVDNSEQAAEKAAPKTEDGFTIVDFDGPDDPANPMNWSARKKSITIALVTLMTVLSPIGSTISSAAAPDIMRFFGSDNQTVGALVTTIYLLGYACGPMVIAPLSELYGRAPLYKICIIWFLIFHVACALAPNLGALVVFRFLAGVGGSCPVTLGTGSIADVVPAAKRPRAMSAYAMGFISGPSIGPIIGGYLTPAAGWRWAFWLMAILSGALALVIIAVLPETYAYVILDKKTKRLNKAAVAAAAAAGQDGTPPLRYKSKLDSGRTPRQHFAFSIGRPLKMLLVPVVFLQSLYAAVVYSYLYLCFTTFPAVFGNQYGFGSGASGLVTLGFFVGCVLGILFCGGVSRRMVVYLAAKNGTGPKPEYLLPTLVVGGVLMPIGLFWYGWSAETRTHWIVPILGTGFLGCGVIITYMASTLYLVDAYTVYAASVTASSTILRCVMATVLPLAGSAMYDRLGFGWGNSVLGFIAVAFLPLAVVLYVFGERIRTTKRFQVNF